MDLSRYPGKELQIDWITIYLQEFLGRPPLEKEVDTLYVQVNKFVLFSYLFWAVWGLIQAEYSDIDFDFIRCVLTIFFHLKNKCMRYHMVMLSF